MARAPGREHGWEERHEYTRSCECREAFEERQFVDRSRRHRYRDLMVPPIRFSLGLLLVVCGQASLAAPPEKPDAEGVEFFEKKVRPVLVKHCYSCHSAEAKKIKGELRLDTREATRKGGATGPAVIPGDPAKSLLIRAVKHLDGVEAMPPEKKLPKEVVADLEAWVMMGAPDPRDGGTGIKRIDLEKAKEFWSFRALPTRSITSSWRSSRRKALSPPRPRTSAR
jgi:hypothetical protein